jgi:hypothetical protein
MKEGRKVKEGRKYLGYAQADMMAMARPTKNLKYGRKEGRESEGRWIKDGRRGGGGGREEGRGRHEVMKKRR